MRKDAGYPPLVTPSSQIVGTQAVFNVMMGRYKVLTGEFADLMLGYYGETIGAARPPRDRTGRTSRPSKPIIDCRPADLLKPEWQELRAAALALDGCNGSDEDVLTYAMFPQVAPKFFATRAEGPKNLGKEPRRRSRLPRRRRPPAARPGGDRDDLRREVERPDAQVTVTPAA